MRDGMRLVSVVLGSASMKAREDASAALLNYGFTFYNTKLIAKGGVMLGTSNVWKAANSPVDLGISHDLYITVPRGDAAGVKTVVLLQPQLMAPLRTDTVVGQFKVLGANGQALVTEPLHPLKAVALGGWWRRMVDSIKLWFA